MEKNKDLIYGPEDRPPFLESVFAALQHMFAIFVAIMTPPLIIASQLNLDIETTSFLVSMALIASGVSTFLQCRRFGPVGTGLLCIQGTSYSFIGPIITAGMGGLGVVFGSCMAASLVEIFVGRILKYARRIITPVVSGIVVTLIGLCLIKVASRHAVAVTRPWRTARSARCVTSVWHRSCCSSSSSSTTARTVTCA